MVSISSAVEIIISRSRYLSEAISKGIINFSALARYIQPEVEQLTKKTVSEASLIMALNRLSTTIRPNYKSTDIFTAPPNMTLKSNLSEIVVLNSQSLPKILPTLLQLSDSQAKYFLTVTQGVFETSIIISNDIEEKACSILDNEKITEKINNLSSITIQLPESSIHSPGILYSLLKSLAWEGINIVEIVSAHLEFTFVVNKKDVNKAFSILESLFTNNVID
ncbi:MAG TPA: aspartate kinase [Candidatus Levybacteria bacterium]|nr:aspartate kinase [Candidatus Levybacteria bacterium]